MEADFWHERWRNNEIGFHQDEVNAWLRHHFGSQASTTDGSMTRRVFVPLCGKSRDMLWLAEQGLEVVGIEVNDIAVKGFFEESGLRPNLEHHGDHTHYVSDGIRVIHGDYFACDREELGPVSDVFDRAALIALPAEMRRRYSDKMAAMIAPDTSMLLVTLDYPQHEMDGPPFSVSEQEVDDLYSGAFNIDRLASSNILDDEHRFRERGVTRLNETAYKLTKI